MGYGTRREGDEERGSAGAGERGGGRGKGEGARGTKGKEGGGVRHAVSTVSVGQSDLDNSS